MSAMFIPRYYDHYAFGQYYKERLDGKVFRWNSPDWVLTTTTIKEIELEIKMSESLIRTRKSIMGRALSGEDIRVGKLLQMHERQAAGKIAGITRNAMIYRCASIFGKLGIKNLEQLRRINL
jgi:hypothetical protein